MSNCGTYIIQQMLLPVLSLETCAKSVYLSTRQISQLTAMLYFILRNCYQPPQRSTSFAMSEKRDKLKPTPSRSYFRKDRFSAFPSSSIVFSILLLPVLARAGHRIVPLYFTFFLRLSSGSPFATCLARDRTLILLFFHFNFFAAERK